MVEGLGRKSHGFQFVPFLHVVDLFRYTLLANTVYVRRHCLPDRPLVRWNRSEHLLGDFGSVGPMVHCSCLEFARRSTTSLTPVGAYCDAVGWPSVIGFVCFEVAPVLAADLAFCIRVVNTGADKTGRFCVTTGSIRKSFKSISDPSSRDGCAA